MKKSLTFVSSLILWVLLLSACTTGVTPTKMAPTDSVPTVVSASPTATAEPSATPQPGRVLLAAPDNSDLKAIQAGLTELAGQKGLTLETRPAIQPGDLTAADQVIVLLTAPPNLADLLKAAPQAQFVVFSATDLQQASNLTVIREKLENQAFIGGFITVLLSTDYRAAGLLPADSPVGDTLKEAFVNGGRYFCGVCAPGWPLNVYYPLVVAQPSKSEGAVWQQGAADAFDNQKVEVYYLTAEALRPEVITYLQGKVQFETAVRVVGSVPPPDVLKPQWAATVHFDRLAAIRQAWEQATAGKGGTVVDAPLLVDNVNPQLLGEGRMRLVKQLLEEINAGGVSPLTVKP